MHNVTFSNDTNFNMTLDTEREFEQGKPSTNYNFETA